MNRLFFAAAFISLLWIFPASAEALPKVLIIGDSISLGYTPYVVKQLEGQAEVIHNRGNAGPTQRGLDSIDQWLGDKEWEVIHFNWGLWDMYHWRYEDFDQSPEAYEKNLETLVGRLKKTGARLIWATTTPACPEPEKKIKVLVDPETEAKYLAAARRVMEANEIEVNDLQALMAPKRVEYGLADNDVHYSPAGSEMLAKQVTEKILSALNGKSG
tara:strand:- start:908 stop:1552 length:645 start_codon:yes stop_codon:yes gene_type:complete